jgi:hypothetical protein
MRGQKNEVMGASYLEIENITLWPSGAYHVLLTGEVLVNGSDMLRNVCILQFICVLAHHSFSK